MPFTWCTQACYGRSTYTDSPAWSSAAPSSSITDLHRGLLIRLTEHPPKPQFTPPTQPHCCPLAPFEYSACVALPLPEFSIVAVTIHCAPTSKSSARRPPRLVRPIHTPSPLAECLSPSALKHAMDALITQTTPRVTTDDCMINAAVSMADSRPTPAGLLWRKGFPPGSTLPSSGLRYSLSNNRDAGLSADVHDALPPTQSA